MTILYFDCFSGASGDMVLGSLIDAGVPLAEVREALGGLSVEPDWVWTERVMRAGVSATKFCVRGEDGDKGHAHEHRHGHHHHDHPHRSLAEISTLLDKSGLSSAGKGKAKELFARLGEAEAAIHGTPIEKVHLHEVGALDSIIDIAGAVFALEWLGVDEVVASPLNVGGGMVDSAHGKYPVPAPATLRLLDGVPMYAGDQKTELVTPTGALLVSSYARRYGPVPEMRLKKVGYGAGARDFAGTPNVLRVLLGEHEGKHQAHAVVVIECEIDDMNPQIFGVLMDQLLAAGALDVFYTPVQMKKGRPGTLLTIVASPGKREVLTSLVFRETTTIGVRYREMTRECLDREETVIATPLGPVRFKIARRGAEILNASPEFDDILRIAERENRPLKDVQALASKAFLDRPKP